MLLKRTFVPLFSMLLVLALVAAPAHALDDARAADARTAIDRAIAYLRQAQNDDGSWSPKYGPAITGLIISGMVRHPEIGRDDPAVRQAIEYILKFVKDDGAIYDRVLPNYNTSLSLMGLGQFGGDEDLAPVIDAAQQYLVAEQWKTGMTDPQGDPITPDHPFYGGAGYGSHGRPDMNNTTVMLEALYDSGFDCNDPAFKRAMVFIQRCQGIESNGMHGDAIEPTGGFIYATSTESDQIGVPETKAGTVAVHGEEKLSTYGSITYAGFKSYLYAQLDADDRRVKAVWEWIANNYTLEHNPRMPEDRKYQSYHYYLYVFARGLNASGEKTVTTAAGKQRDWADDVISQLVELQRKEGSWVNGRAGRWNESDPNLVTAYGLIALHNALGRR